MSPFLRLADVLFRRDGALDPAASAILARAVAHAARRLGKTVNDEQDLLQELYLQLFRHHLSNDRGYSEGAIEDEDQLFFSCVQVAMNRLVDEYRKTGRVRAEDPAVLDTGAGPEPTVTDPNDLDLNAIGHKKAEEVMRLLLEGRSVAEVAKTMHMTPRNVLHLKQRGVERLRERANRDTNNPPG